eukprot:1693605-Prymnesium_polylepis.1
MAPPLVISIPAPVSLEDFTISIEQACKLLAKQPTVRAVLKFKSAEDEGLVQPSDFSFEGLQRWEKALSLLQQQGQLVAAVLDGPVYDLSLSAALACDVRLCTSRTCLPAPASEMHEPLPLWWLASLALHVGALRAQQMLFRRAAITAAELVATGVVHAASDDAADLLKTVGALPIAPNVPIQLLRRISRQGFSIEASDIIGHALAVNSLVITDTMSTRTAPRAHHAARMPRPPRACHDGASAAHAAAPAATHRWSPPVAAARRCSLLDVCDLRHSARSSTLTPS